MTRVVERKAAALVVALAVVAAVACGRKEPGATAAAKAGAESGSTGEQPSAAAPATAPAAATPPATSPAAPEGAPAAAATAPATTEPPAPASKEVVLFFEASDDDVLVPEKRTIPMPDSAAEAAKRIVTELAAGPRKEGLLPTLPAGTKVLGVYLDRAGTAFLDLSEEFVSLHPGGSDDEVATIFSVVDTLTWNVKEIKRVRFLVAGEERDTLKNHLDLRRAYLKDMSIVNMDSTDGAGGGVR
jgi:Sporulation and spore germination